MLRDGWKEGEQSNGLFCLRPDYSEFVVYRLKQSVLVKIVYHYVRGSYSYV